MGWTVGAADEGNLNLEASALSPSGDRVAFRIEEELVVAPVARHAGEESVVVDCPGGGPSDVAFSPSGQLVSVYTRRSGALAVHSAGGALVRRIENAGEPETPSCALGFVTEDTIAVTHSSGLALWSAKSGARAGDATLPDGHRPTRACLSPFGTAWYTQVSFELGVIQTLPRGSRCDVLPAVWVEGSFSLSSDDELLALWQPNDASVEIHARSPRRLVCRLPFPEKCPDKDAGAVALSPTRDRVAVACANVVYVLPFRR